MIRHLVLILYVVCMLACGAFILLALLTLSVFSSEPGLIKAATALGHFLSACAFGLAMSELHDAINRLDGTTGPDFVDAIDQEEF